MVTKMERSKAACYMVGSLLLALGVTLFLQPNQIASGGTPGLAILLANVSPLSVGMAMLAINIPLLIIGGFGLGQSLVWRTVAVVGTTSLVVDLCHDWLRNQHITWHPMLAAACAGIVIGIGVGLILRGQATAGGPTIIARLLSHHYQIRPGRVILVMDSVIVIASALVFHSFRPALLSLLCVIITGRCIDLTMNSHDPRLTQTAHVCCKEKQFK